MKKLSLIPLLLISLLSWANGPDSTQLSHKLFLELVLANHPVSKQADLTIEFGEETFRASKGGFDPEVKVGFDQKRFGGKEYFQLNKNEITLPTRLGVQLRAGYEQNSGEFLNPEAFVPESGLVYSGIMVPLGKGLLIDERRKTRNQAELFMQASEFEQKLLLNELLAEASITYWKWVGSWGAYEVSNNALSLAEDRFEGIRERYRQGDAPAIDTLEAYILYQQRQVRKADALGTLLQSKAKLNNYLWDDQLQPMELVETIKPENLETISFGLTTDFDFQKKIFDDALENHPELALFDNRLSSLEIERRYKVESLKPKVNLNYNFLVEPMSGNEANQFSTSNYKWGVEFRMPIFLRKERAELSMTKIKVTQVELKRQATAQKIQNEFLGYLNELSALREQISVYRNVVTNYQNLLQGEKMKFESGESSVFLVNSREENLINAEIKLIELIGKMKQREAELARAMGNSEIIL